MDIHVANQTEYNELKELWCEVFGDEPSLVDKFYELTNAIGYVCVENDSVVSCLSLYEVGVFDNRKVFASYAVCTSPTERGKGYASALVEHVRKAVTAQGSISIVCPADCSLVDYYSQLGYSSIFYAKEQTVPAENDIFINLKTVSSEEYNHYRELFLANESHIVVNHGALEYARFASANEQGLVLVNDGDAICIIDDGDEDELSISELIVNPALSQLSSEISFQLAAGIAELFESQAAIFHEPTFIVYTDISGDYYSNGSYAQAMAAFPNDICEEISSEGYNLPYYGLPVK